MKKQGTGTTADVLVYQHRRMSDSEIFYVGIGNSTRPYSLSSRNRHWHFYTKKYSYAVDILFQGLTWEEACAKEKSLILEHGRRDLRTGTLVNMTDGGDGQVNLALESRLKISLAKRGKVTWMKGKKHTEEAKQKNREKHYGKVPPNKGKPSPRRGIKRPNHSVLMAGSGNSNAKRVRCLSTGQVYGSALDFMTESGLSNYYRFHKLINNKQVEWIRE